MKNLTFVHTGQAVGKRILGGLLIVFAVIPLISAYSFNQSDWLGSIFLFSLGAISFTPLVGGSDKSYIGISENNLKIEWRGRIRKLTIPETEIEKIKCTTAYVLITRKERKHVSMAIDNMEEEQKIKIYEFLNGYAQQKSLVLENDCVDDEGNSIASFYR